MFPMAPVHGGEGQHLGSLGQSADEDATIIFVWTAMDDTRTIKQALNDRIPEVARIVGGI